MVDEKKQKTDHPHVTICADEDAGIVKEQVLKALKALDTTKICSTCGGLLPDVLIEFKNNSYTLTCWRVVTPRYFIVGEDGTKEEAQAPTVTETDYQKLGEWCICTYGLTPKVEEILKRKREGAN